MAGTLMARTLMSRTPTIDMQDPTEDSKVESIWCNILSGHMSSRFKAVLLYYSESDNIEDAINEWNLYKVSDANDVSSICICSHDIHHEYYVRHQTNGNILRIGSECINKFMGEDVRTDADILRKQLQYQKKGNGSKRICESCHHHKIPIDAPIWKVKCKSCFTTNPKTTTVPLIYVDGKTCSVCKRLTIHHDEPEWKTICKGCYNNGHRTAPMMPTPMMSANMMPANMMPVNMMSRHMTQYRTCDTCHVSNIPVHDPHWKKQCLTCYRNKK